jgi:hypothetical protein
MFPEIRTHNDNIPIYDLPPNATKEWKTFYEKSLFMIGRKKELTSFIDKVKGTITNYNKELILIRGIYGSGKSLFIRKGLNEIISQFNDLKTNSFSFKKIFVSFQTPISFYDPMNGWRQIFQKIFNFIKNDFFEKKVLQKQEFPFTYGLEKIGIQCDLIGRILFKSGSYSYIRFIEEILNVTLINFRYH